MLFSMRSVFTGKTNQMDLPVTPEQINEWKISGRVIQEALPMLNADQREFLLSGSTPEEWDEVFGGDEE